MDKIQKAEQGSIFQTANDKGLKTEEVLMDADVVMMVDQSTSMRGESQEGAQEAVKRLQNQFPGRVVLLEFATFANWKFDGKLTGPSGNTNLCDALEKCLELDDGEMKFFLVSDGAPNDVDGAYDLADHFISPINTVYVGPDMGRGMQVMNEIARLTKGDARGKLDPLLLGEHIVGLLKEA